VVAAAAAADDGDNQVSTDVMDGSVSDTTLMYHDGAATAIC